MMRSHPLVRAAHTAPARPTRRWRSVPPPARQTFTRALANLVRAGFPLVDALEAAQPRRAGRGRGCMHAVATDLSTCVRRGGALSDALARHPSIFSPLYVQLVRVGERTGTLADMLDRLAAHLDRSAALARRVRLALVYPALIVIVAAGSTVFLLTAVVPTFAALYRDFGAELPASTRAVLAAGDALARYGFAIALGTAAAAIGLPTLARAPAARRRLDPVALRLPLGGRFLGLVVCARACRGLETLLHGGVPLVEALEAVAPLSGNARAERDLEQVAAAVRRGQPLGPAIRAVPWMPDDVAQMMALGEQSAELPSLLRHAATMLEDRVAARVDVLVGLVEPTLVLVVGVLLGGLLAALYLPIFSLIEVLGT